MVLDAALILSVLASLLGLSELVLRESQMRAIRRFADEITLRLDYCRPLHWFNSLQNPSPAIPFAAFLSYVVLYAGFAGNLCCLPDLVLFCLFILSSVGTILLCRALVQWRRAESVLRLLKGDHSIWHLLCRTFRIAKQSLWQGLVLGIPATIATQFVSFLMVLMVLLVLFAFNLHFETESTVATSLSESVAFLSSLVTLIIVSGYLYKLHPERFLLWQFGIPIVIVVITLACLLVSLELAFKFIRGLLWRIVEYQKGPVAALTLIATAILGIVKVFVD